MWSIGTESVIWSLSCAGFLRYPGVDMMTLSTVWNARRRMKEKDADLAEAIHVQRGRCFKIYGYRRMWLWLEKQGTHRNPRQFCESWRNTAFGQKFAAGDNGFRWVNNCTNMKTFWSVHFKQTGPTANGWPISPTSTPKRECCTHPRFVICIITALLPIRPVHSRRWISFWIPSAWLWWRRKRESLQRCSSTATKGFNTLPESIFTWLNPMV